MGKTQVETVRYAVIGGSGMYDMEDLNKIGTFFPTTPFGKPSDEILIGEFQGVRCAFLPRHGRGHRFLPGEIPQRANLFALKLLGVEFVVALSACGSFQEKFAPRHFVIPNQLVDRSTGRPSTFFGDGIVAHIPFAKPFSETLSGVLLDAARQIGVSVHGGGTYLCVEGPAFSTRAESLFHREMEWDVVGMTASPEAKLAREAEMSYALVAMVTDYDAWKEGEEVSGQAVLGHMVANAANARRLVAEVLPRLTGITNEHANALRGAIFTSPKAIPAERKKKLAPLIGRYTT